MWRQSGARLGVSFNVSLAWELGPRLLHSEEAGLIGRSRGGVGKEQHTCSASARVMDPCDAVNSS